MEETQKSKNKYVCYVTQWIHHTLLLLGCLMVYLSYQVLITGARFDWIPAVDVQQLQQHEVRRK